MIPLVLAMALQAATSVPTPPAAAPSPVVERVVTVNGRKVRLSLFDNREAVVSVHGRDGSVTLRRRRLREHEYGVYLEVLEENLPQLEKLGGEADLIEEGGRGQITIYRTGKPPLVLRYAALQTPKLALGRVIAALDDLEEEVLRTNTGHDQLEAWEPRVGDQVVMVNGQTATVTEVHANGVVVVEYDQVAMVEVIPFDQRARRIARLLAVRR